MIEAYGHWQAVRWRPISELVATDVDTSLHYILHQKWACHWQAVKWRIHGHSRELEATEVQSTIHYILTFSYV
jgi:hypothetical protein